MATITLNLTDAQLAALNLEVAEVNAGLSIEEYTSGQFSAFFLSLEAKHTKLEEKEVANKYSKVDVAIQDEIKNLLGITK